MSTAAHSAETLLTAEQFAARPESGLVEELVRGTIEVSPPPGARHGYICANIVARLHALVREHALGRIVANDAGVITERNPDTVRGPDVAFYSFEKVPRGPLPAGYPSVPPDAVFEVMSPGDRWPRVMQKVAEYLGVGVPFVVVLDPEDDTVTVCTQDRPPWTLARTNILVLPPSLANMNISIHEFFD